MFSDCSNVQRCLQAIDTQTTNKGLHLFTHPRPHAHGSNNSRQSSFLSGPFLTQSMSPLESWLFAQLNRSCCPIRLIVSSSFPHWESLFSQPGFDYGHCVPPCPVSSGRSLPTALKLTLHPLLASNLAGPMRDTHVESFKDISWTLAIFYTWPSSWALIQHSASLDSTPITMPDARTRR